MFFDKKGFVKRCFYKQLSLTMAVLCFILLLFSGCSESKQDNSIRLTKENFENYVNLTCRASGASSAYNNGKYDGMIGYATCTGIAGYYYENVSVTIRIHFDDGRNEANPRINLRLNVGGNASGQQYYTICNKQTGYTAYVTSSDITAYSTYSIESVSGTVTRN